MQEDDSYSDQIQFQDEYSPIRMEDNDKQNDQFIGQKLFNKLQLSQKVIKFHKTYKKSTGKTFMHLFQFKDQVQEQKSICAKSIQRSETIAECYDCATDRSCIQCMECFRNSNHEGHKVVIKKAYGGCCDCGDIQAWKKQGFCNKHTGETVDIQIDEKEQEYFLSEMKQIFFLLFWQISIQNLNQSRSYQKTLLEILLYLNEKGVYYNKLTQMVLNSKLPQQLVISKNVNNRTILTNILNPKISKNLDIDEWMQLFFKMFQYYPFKKLLLSCYMKNFSIIYDQQQNQISRGNSISCQLLTSHQLVREYALEQGSIPLGSNINLNRVATFQNIFFVLYHDLNYITKLSGDTPQVYFRFHMSQKGGLMKLFDYRDVIRFHQDSHPDASTILELAKFVKYFQVQYKALELLSKVAGILRKDKQTLATIIKTLYDQSLKQTNQKKMIIFKPLTRALTLFLFAYFDMDLEKVQDEKNQLARKLVKDVLNVSYEEFGLNLSKLFRVCAETYLFHSKILAEPGLNTTLYVYLYFYKLKNRFISSLDILSVKLFSMMHSWSIVNSQPVISPQEYIWQSSISVTQAAKRHQLQRKLLHLQLVLSQLNLVSTSKSNEVYIAYQIDQKCDLYKQYMQSLLIKLLNQEKGNLSLVNVKDYEQTFFHPNVNLAQNYLKKLCSYDKAKKAFVLKKEYEINQGAAVDSLNYNDFRCNLTNKTQFQSPQKTLKLIKQTYNERVYDNLYSIQTIKKLIIKGVQIMKNLISAQETSSQKQPYTFNIQKMKPLFNELLKIIYIKSNVSSQDQQLSVVVDYVRKVSRIDEIVNLFYETLLHPEKMQIRVAGFTEQSSKQNQRMAVQVKTNSSQQEKLRKLREKMQLKRKAIKQRYTMQISKFQQQEKLKLQNQQLNEERQYQQKLNCIICKSQEQENLVFLVKVSYKNHEKLLNLGEGVNCMSVLSCYHSIDYDCYKKLQMQVNNKKKPRIKCPFCKFSTNTFLPISAKSKHVPDALKRLQGTLFMQKNFDEISVLQQIVKSFYHFALLASLDPQRTLHRRLRIYRIIFQILKYNTELYDFKKIYEKFIHNTMNLNPKLLVQQLYEMKRNERMVELAMMLENSQDSVSLEDLDQSQIERIIQIMQMSQNQANGQENSNWNFNNLPQFMTETVKSLQEKMGLGKQNKKKNQQGINKMTTIFKQTLKRLFKKLGLKYAIIETKQEQKQEKVQKMQTEQPQQKLQFKKQPHIDQQLSPPIQICLKRLFQTKQAHTMLHHHSSIYGQEILTQNNNLLKLRDLPLNFRPLGKCNKCKNCNEITSTITLCLLCQWQGCIRNCMAKKSKQLKGGANYHSRKHGEQSIYLILEQCNVANITVQGTYYNLGCIYKDEWGMDFDHKKDWEKYFLDQGELQKIRVNFLHQE